ncbi:MULTISPECIES: DUF4184 family protein [Streptomyces]|uniref:DUF4184 family protein n=2 Tax=Streptomyces rimosus subsp. rimosus TaxID=132474 RepID=L8EMF7_STRR1|nr:MULTISPECIES: DUF4184 family protein [Streptomyces]KOG68899.1 membrane protein [Kitasatospora aureofaciens]MYT44835.1 DUF4184 family protein [Streptomyces sp. SID5471]KEF03354.1 membrane protein [Streptomyces rimosus]KEF17584.1 membrane protein [Streptomyces rimosus]KOT26958.1 membrane protein [Streptomyces sp. NRRL WC-3701]
MPFTLSHAAAVLPVVRRTGEARGPLVASALVAGSFAPDLTYFADSVLPGAMLFGDFTHGIPGVLTVDVLITAVLVGGWLLLREPLVALLPTAWRGKVYAVVRGRPGTGGRPLAAYLALFYVSAVLGALTHIVWDAFTHPGRWGTRLVPVLNEVVGGFPLCTYVQYGTSALALGVIGWFLWTALRQVPDPAAPAGLPEPVGGRLPAVALLSVCLLAGAVHRTLRARAEFGEMAVTWFDYVPTVLFGAGAGLALGLPLYAAMARVLHRRYRTAPADGSAAYDRSGARP